MEIGIFCIVLLRSCVEIVLKSTPCRIRRPVTTFAGTSDSLSGSVLVKYEFHIFIMILATFHPAAHHFMSLISSADEAKTCLTIRIVFTTRWIAKKTEGVRLSFHSATWLCVLLMFSICTRVVVPCVDAFCSFYASLESTPPFITPAIRQLTSLHL